MHFTEQIPKFLVEHDVKFESQEVILEWFPNLPVFCLTLRLIWFALEEL